jgi:DNA-binding MarR family transcriptional regulator
MNTDEWQLAPWICTALIRIGSRLATGFDRHFAHIGLTQAQFRALLEVWEKGGPDGMAPSVLADHLFLERATVSVLTNRMEELGWLERREGESRRTYNLVITAAGERLLMEAIPQATALADNTLAGISPERLNELRATLVQVEAHLRENVPPSASSAP